MAAEMQPTPPVSLPVSPNEKILTGYISHKTGTGHNDFSKPYAIYLEPAKRSTLAKKR